MYEMSAHRPAFKAFVSPFFECRFLIFEIFYSNSFVCSDICLTS
jgi:hypothetical protein